MFFKAVFEVLDKIYETGKISDNPTAPPPISANVSAKGPTSSPNCLAASILSACCETPAGTAIAAGKPYCPTIGLTNFLCAKALPTKPAPKKGANDPNPSESFVVKVSS